MLRLPPGRITKWAVLRADNDQVLTPGGGSWDSAVHADVDFICRVALPGMFGVSGDLISLSAEVHKKLQHYIAFYKHWREFLLDSTCQLLTPPRMIDDRSDWVAFQFQNASQPQTSLLFVYRLADKDPSKLFYLRNIDDSQSYNVIQLDEAEISNQISGIDLHTFGLTIHLPQINSATILLIQEVT